MIAVPPPRWPPRWPPPRPAPGRLLHRRGQREALPVTQARALGCDMASYVPGHPLAGREQHGPAAARADLFLGRPWALCPGRRDLPAGGRGRHDPGQDAAAREPVRADADEHDRWVALVSHAPHVVAAAMAARLRPTPAGGALGLAGQGLRDVTRIAAGDTGLWTQILAANADPGGQGAGTAAGRRPGRGAAAGTLPTATPVKSVAALLEERPGRGGEDPGQAGGAPRGSTRWSRSSSPTGPASWPGCSRRPARPASTSRTSGSSTRPACRSVWPS